jgi:hypothetical protein
MARPRDQQLDDFEDGRGPEPDPARPSPAAHPLRPFLGCGLLFGVVVLFCGLALFWEKVDRRRSIARPSGCTARTT